MIQLELLHEELVVVTNQWVVSVDALHLRILESEVSEDSHAEMLTVRGSEHNCAPPLRRGYLYSAVLPGLQEVAPWLPGINGETKTLSGY